MALKALPFASSFVLVPLVLAASILGGWWVLAPFLFGWIVISFLDRVLSRDTRNMDPATLDDALFWHKLVTWAWVPTQAVLILATLWIATDGHLGRGEALVTALGLGLATGGVGITFAHEMVHQRNRWERWAGEFLLTSVAYGHFATEHVHGHHVHVGTPKDPVSARKGENFYAFFVRAVAGSLISAWRTDRERLSRRGRPAWHWTNPFWRYGLGTAGWLTAAYAVGGWWAVGLFGVQSFMAVFQLEAVNYVEHYGLQRRLLPNGKFERVQPHHSWNASHRFSNWLLINLQRHSDHHHRPDRRFPLLQHHSWKTAPQLPASYSLMIALATNPPLWFRVMNRRVERWRAEFYPGVGGWDEYDRGTIGREVMRRA